MKRLVACICVAVMLCSCSSKTEDLNITGQVQGIKKGKLFLQKIKDTALINIDSFSFYNSSSFKFSVEVEQPEVLFLQLQKDTLSQADDYITFFADKGNLEVNAKLDQFLLASITADYDNQNKFNTYLENIKKFSNLKLDLIKAELEARKQMDMQKIDSVNRAFNQIDKRRILYAINFAKTNPSLEVSPYVMITQAPYINNNYLDTVYLSLDQKIQKSLYGRKLKALIDETE